MGNHQHKVVVDSVEESNTKDRRNLLNGFKESRRKKIIWSAQAFFPPLGENAHQQGWIRILDLTLHSILEDPTSPKVLSTHLSELRQNVVIPLLGVGKLLASVPPLACRKGN